MLLTMQLGTLVLTTLLGTTPAMAQTPVPGSVPPVVQTMAPNFADDTRGVFVPHHKQLRMRSQHELENGLGQMQLAQASGSVTDDEFAREMERLAGEGSTYDTEMNRISGSGQQQQAAPQMMQHQGAPANNTFAPHTPSFTPDGGVEVAVGQPAVRGQVDMSNALVRVREERITVRRVVQRMMDQIGASDWTIVWDLSQQNLPLAEMEISIDAHEPFTNVLNALLARLQTRSGQPLRVIRYDNTRRLVITDRTSGHRLSSDSVSPFGVETDGQVVVTERMVKEAMISLHYDEIPLVDALESIVNQAGKGQWRLRIYAGIDQVLKPAHIEEPFSTAMERLLRLFNLKYEIFPGGKLVVVTQTNRFGYGTGQ